MDTESVSHSPEGHRLPCHSSKLTPETSGEQDFPSTRTDSYAAVTPLGHQPDTLGAPALLSGHQRRQVDIYGALTAFKRRAKYF